MAKKSSRSSNFPKTPHGITVTLNTFFLNISHSSPGITRPVELGYYVSSCYLKTFPTNRDRYSSDAIRRKPLHG
jgi:hypothetical protein